MARTKKNETKPVESTLEEKSDTVPKPEAPTSEVETSVPDSAEPQDQDAVIVEEADQNGVPESQVDESPQPLRGNHPRSKPPAAHTEPRRSGAGLWTMLVGGVLAAVIGFGTSQYLGNENWPFAAGPSELEQQVFSQSARIDELAAQVISLESSIGEDDQTTGQLSDLRSGQEALQQSLTEVGDRIATLDERLTDLENRPIPTGASGEAVAAYQEQLAGMRAMFEEELARIEAAQSKAVSQEETAAERAEAALVQAAFVRLQTAIESGAPFGDALQDLQSGGLDLPEPLVAAAPEGVATLASLQRSFPAAARDALQASVRTQADQGEVDRFTAFLLTQLGARSLEPKEGNDPDAVLSRAEAALRDGDLAGALSELQALPETGTEAMSGWIARAETRREAVAATAALSDTLNN